MKKTLFALIGLICTIGAYADDTKSQYDLDAPFGFCTVSSRTNNNPYSITGGGCYQYPVTGVAESKVTTLTSNGTDMRNAIINAINDYDVIVFDGSNGDFIVSKNIDLEGVKGKTLLGINGARLCTQWYLTSEMIAALDEAGVKSMSTSGGGGTLPNGKNVSEEAEYNVRRILIEMTGDNTEQTFQKAGIFSISKNSENIIIRNLTFQGPGSVDVGGSDLISIIGSKHIWVDHCVFKDGTDGNLDITNSADFNTISWCTFSYSNRSYMHQNTNLVGSSDSEDTGYLNTTYAFNWWGKGCDQRMPMARVGKIHMLNNYYTCSGSSGAINPRKNSEFLIEGNYIDTGVERYYSQKDATAVTWTTNNFIAAASELPSSKGSTVTVPYSYTANSYDIVPTDVRQFAGATLFPEYNETKPTGAITWPFDTGAAGQIATVASYFGEGIASTSVALGSDLAYNGANTVNGIKETYIQDRAYQSSAASANNAMTFTINITDGYKFTATSVSFTSSRIGTDAGKIDATWIDNGGETSLATGVTPHRNSTPKGKPDESPFYTTFDYDLQDIATESTNNCKLILNLYGVTTGYKKVDNVETTELNYKDYGFANIIVNGTIVAPTGISTPVTFTLPVTTEYYNLAGQRVSSNTKGIVIEKQRMQDGTVKAVKKIRR